MHRCCSAQFITEIITAKGAKVFLKNWFAKGTKGEKRAFLMLNLDFQINFLAPKARHIRERFISSAEGAECW